MSLRTTERILITSGLALMLAAGCGDGDKPPTVTGEMDAGRPKDAGTRDTGSEEDDTLPSMSCGSRKCTGAVVQQTVINPCCVPDSNVCGLDAVDLRRANSSTPFTGCVPKDVEPSVENSVYCGEFWDQVEMVKKANGGLDIASGPVTLTFDGCCLPSGECGALINTPRNQDPEVVNTHLGCVSFNRLQAAFAAADAATTEQPAHLPFCNPSTGDPLMGDETAPGVPKFVCGCGVGTVVESTDKSRTFPCLNNLPTTVCGADEPDEEQLAQVPEFICGCVGALPNGLPCMTNVDKAVCGGNQITAASPELARVPKFICGAGATASALPTLKGVDPSVCGTKDPSAAELAQVPAFICGEMSNPDTSGLPKLKNLPATTCGTLAIASGSPYIATVPEFLCGCPTNPTFPCLRNVDTTVCGGKEITTGAAELAAVPEFTCGCGATTVDPHTSLPCLSKVEATVCGAKEITATSTELNTVPEFICGLEGLTTTPSLPVLRNVPSTVCGKKEITSSSAELAAIPQFICGLENTTDTSSLPKMANVDTTVCGTKVITQDSVELDSIPQFICGAVGLTSTPALPVLRNVSTTICGEKAIATGATELNQIPAFICGEVGNTDPTALPKMRNVAGTVCGAIPVAAGSPFLAGVPKFLCGCTSTLARELGCMRNVDFAVCGAATPSAALLTQVPEFVCGCGAATKDQGIGSLCLSFIETTTCGTKDTTLSTRAALGGIACLVGVPEYAFGCGDNASPSASNPCLRNAGTTANTPGCDDVTSTTTNVYGLRRLPEYLCGCGDTSPSSTGRGDAPLPCLPFLTASLCGGLPISASAQLPATLNSRVCGCGDGVNVTTAVCLDNVPGSVCGPTPYCTEGDIGVAPCASGQTCVDVQGGTGAGAGGAGGAGDDRGDNCAP